MALCLWLLWLARGSCVVPAGQLLMRGRSGALHFAPGSLSKARLPEMGDTDYQRLLLPTNGEAGCASAITVPPYFPPYKNFALLLERGECSYQQKAIAAQRAGAASVLIANTVRGVYGDRGHALVSDVNCEAGMAWLDASRVLSPPYLPAMRERMPAECTGDARCASGQCLLTNVTRPGQVQTCCAWDLWQNIGRGSETPGPASAAGSAAGSADSYNEDVTIPIGFLRMADTERLLRAPELQRYTLDIVLCARDTSWSWASFFCWGMAVVTVAYASARAAREERSQWYKQGPALSDYRESVDDLSVGSVPSIRPLQSRRKGHGKGKGRDKGRGHADRSVIEDETAGLLSGGRGRGIGAAGGDGDGDGTFGGYGTSPCKGDRSTYGIESRLSSTDGDEHSLASSASEYYLRVKGKFVHSAVQEGEGDSPLDAEEFTPRLVVLGVLGMSCSLLLFYFINVYWILTSVFLCVSTLAIHVLFLEGPVLLLLCHAQDKCSSCVARLRCCCCSDRGSDIGSDRFSDQHAEEQFDAEESVKGLAETDALLVGGGYQKEPHGGSNRAIGHKRHGEEQRAPPSSWQVLSSLIRKMCTLAHLANCVCFCCAASLPLLWLFNRHSPYAWVLQDVFAMCLVTMFLGQMKLGNLAALTTLLGLAFCYDVFFVFVEPMLFGGESVMASVAQQHAAVSPPAHPEQADGNYCDKYPRETVCHPDQIPMMLVVPALFTWDVYDAQMLGLGDLLLPGLLVVWTARYDMRRYGSLSSEQAGAGYFPLAVFCYAAGMCLATTAVQYFAVGQPALLYLVPCTLLPILFRASSEGSLGALWKELPPMRTVAQSVNEDKLEEYRQREAVTCTTAAWPPDVEQERRVVSLDAARTAVAPLPRPTGGQSKHSLYKSVFKGLGKDVQVEAQAEAEAQARDV